MPNQRAEDQEFVGLQMARELLLLLEKARQALGSDGKRIDRSQFVRDAIKEKLENLGYDVPRDISSPPDRVRRLAVAENGAALQMPATKKVKYTKDKRARKKK